MIFSSIVFVSIVSPTFAFATKSSIVVNIQRGGCGSVTPPPIITVNAVSPKSSNHTNNRGGTPKMCLQSSSSTTATSSTSKQIIPSQLVTRRGNRSNRRVASELQSVAIPSSSSESSLSSKDQESEATSDKCSINASSNTNTTTTTSAIVRRFWDRCRTVTTKIDNNQQNPSIESSTIQLSNPRVMACIYMGISMSLHYSGYEFVRNSALSLFTSDDGFPQPIAFPLMNGIISPISIYLLYIYTKQLEIQGPKKTLHNFTKSCITFIVLSSLILWQCSIWSIGSAFTSMSRPIYTLFIQNVQRIVIALMFLFNNCYVFMIASQQWSFIDSIVTPNEGAQWFGILTGICSVLCTISAGIIPYILPHVGLIGMYSMTAVTLYGTLLCGNRAYTIAEQNGFDPALQQNERTKKKLEQQKRDQLLNKSSESKGDVSENSSSSRISDAIALFRRVPTLRALMLEGISFQSLGTILSVAMIRALKVQIPDDIARSAYTGRFYACVSGISAFFQFVILPIGMKRLEPKHLWRIMPILPILVTVYQILFPFLNHNHISQLTLVASALFITKLLDYSVRVVIYNMAYQPLDFESRFVGKEIINVFGGRVGRSGMSLFLSGLTIFPIFSSSLRPLAYFACSASTIWGVSAWWLSTLLPTKADAQRTVVERRKEFENEQKAKKR